MCKKLKEKHCDKKIKQQSKLFSYKIKENTILRKIKSSTTNNPKDNKLMDEILNYKENKMRAQKWAKTSDMNRSDTSKGQQHKELLLLSLIANFKEFEGIYSSV